ncbi:hypothetical protein B0H11DRAFT_1908385 [Mycena galericulata]|nr:hypothetical protein B0H11DRAFT_1908385 [Mycena galericulata]
MPPPHQHDDDSQCPRAPTRLPELLAVALPVRRRDSDEKVADWSSALARECVNAVCSCFAGPLGDEAKVVPKSAHIYVDLNAFLYLNFSFRRSQKMRQCFYIIITYCNFKRRRLEISLRVALLPAPRACAGGDWSSNWCLMGPAQGVFAALHSASADASFKVDGEEGDRSGDRSRVGPVNDVDYFNFFPSSSLLLGLKKCDTPWNGIGQLGTYTEPSSGF